MRLLKAKIAHNIEIRNAKSEAVNSSSPSTVTPPERVTETIPKTQQRETTGKRIKRNRVAGCPLVDKSTLAAKNILKNFGRQICTFSSSEVSRHYLKVLADEEKIEMSKYQQFMADKKVKINGIDSFREMILIEPEDSNMMKSYKKITQSLGIIFVKYFSVNWIFNSRLTYKDVHVKFRFKVLRRILHPELCTYMK